MKVFDGQAFVVPKIVLKPYNYTFILECFGIFCLRYASDDL